MHTICISPNKNLHASGIRDSASQSQKNYGNAVIPAFSLVRYILQEHRSHTKYLWEHCSHAFPHHHTLLTPAKLPFPIDLLCRPYNSVRTAVRHCDMHRLRIRDFCLKFLKIWEFYEIFKIPKRSWILSTFKIHKIRILNLWGYVQT